MEYIVVSFFVGLIVGYAVCYGVFARRKSVSAFRNKTPDKVSPDMLPLDEIPSGCPEEVIELVRQLNETIDRMREYIRSTREKVRLNRKNY